jgi:hypothetical protein
MRATFITTALENGATLEEVQRAAGHAEPGTTELMIGADITRRNRLRFMLHIRVREHRAIRVIGAVQ